jgi:hypothetical protein
MVKALFGLQKYPLFDVYGLLFPKYLKTALGVLERHT